MTKHERQQMMKAITIREPGAPEVLTLSESPVPSVGDGEVLIRARAAGVNRSDILQRMGKYPPPPGASTIPGLEVSGEVVESRSPFWAEGDHVCALLEGGGYAEYCVTAGTQCLPIPEGSRFEDAAALPEALFTVWSNVFVRGRLKSGETLLVHGGASGIGTMAIQMAHQAGAKVFVTAGDGEKCTECLELGANAAINYKKHDFTEMIEKESVDVVLDMVGGDYIPKNISLLRENGRHVSIAFQGGRQAQVDIAEIMRKRIILTGGTLRSASREEKAILRQGILDHIWPEITAGHIKPFISRTFPLSEAAAAHSFMEDGKHIGKIVLEI
jgi:NADPH2:quinone reductase